MTEPPLLTGGVKLIVACVFPGEALSPVGASGTVAGITEPEVALAALFPIGLVAIIVNV